MIINVEELTVGQVLALNKAAEDSMGDPTIFDE